MLDTKIPPVAVALVSCVMAWCLARFAPGEVYNNPVICFTAIMLSILGVIIVVAGLIEFRKANTTFDPQALIATSSLVTTGIYKISRNPMYLGFALIVAGWSILQGSPWAIVPILFFVLYISAFQIRPEEDMMRQKFGEMYALYSKNTRRWI